jgi:hypothetical protein
MRDSPRTLGSGTISIWSNRATLSHRPQALWPPAKSVSRRTPPMIDAASEPSRAQRAWGEMGFCGHPCAILLDRSSDAQRLDRSLKGSLHFPRTGFLICVRRKRKREHARRALAVDTQIDPAPERGSGAVFTISCRSEQSPRLNCRPPRHQRSTLAAGSSPPPAAALFVGASCLAKSKVSVARRLSLRVPNRSPTLALARSWT